MAFPNDVARFSGVFVDFDITSAPLPVGSVVRYPVDGMLYVSTDAAAPAFSAVPVGGGGPPVGPAGGDLTGTYPNPSVAANAVDNTKLAQMPAGTLKGNNTGGAADPLDVTATDVTALLDLFTSALQGLAPASGGGTANFLRADGTWAVPPGGGGGTLDHAALTSNLAWATSGHTGTVSTFAAFDGGGAAVHLSTTATGGVVNGTWPALTVISATTTTAGVVELATDGEVAANVAVQGNDSRLADARTPTVAGEANGDVLVFTGGAWTALPPGTSGFALTSNGAGVAPSYQAVGGGGVGSIIVGSLPLNSVNATTTLASAGFTGLGAIAEGTYEIEAIALYEAGAAEDAVYAFVVTNGTINWITDLDNPGAPVNNSGDTADCTGGGLGDTRANRFTGTLRIAGGGGSLDVQWAQRAAGGNAATLFATDSGTGAWVTLTRVE